jgi:hypothetical protein
LSSAPLNRDFDDAKAEGTAVEWLLVDLLVAHRWFAYPNQIAWDAAGENSAAKALGPDGWDLPAPDIDAQTPAPCSHRMGFEVKSKVPRDKDGSFGWDMEAFCKAERWQKLMGAPVCYVIRDRSVAPVPTGRRKLDTLDPWLFASLHQLRLCEPDRLTKPYEDWDGDRQERTTWYWPREVFAPLSELLEGGFTIAPVLLRPKRAFGVGRCF